MKQQKRKKITNLSISTSRFLNNIFTQNNTQVLIKKKKRKSYS